MKSSQSLTVGNDIVDLQIEEPPLHPRYIERVCTYFEIDQIGGDSTELWLHWAAKEAGYKALKRLDSWVSFLPKHFEFDQLSQTLKWRSLKLPCRIRRSKRYVHVTCSHRFEILANAKEWIIALDQESQLDPSVAVRYLAGEKLSEYFHVDTGDIKINWTCGIPSLIHPISGDFYPISFSHHGSFVACAIATFQSSDSSKTKTHFNYGHFYP